MLPEPSFLTLETLLTEKTSSQLYKKLDELNDKVPYVENEVTFLGEGLGGQAARVKVKFIVSDEQLEQVLQVLLDKLDSNLTKELANH